MIAVTKKEQIWRKKRNSCRKTQRKNINHLSRQEPSDQGEKQKVGGLIASIQL